MTAPPQVVGRPGPAQTPAAASAAPSTASPSTADKTKREATTPRHSRPPPLDPAVKLKVVVRRLPPHLPEAVFRESTKEWIHESTVDWFYYAPGKLHDR
jgi:regulator of nonsense transcripts 3